MGEQMSLLEIAAIASIINGLITQPLWLLWVLHNHYKEHKGEKDGG